MDTMEHTALGNTLWIENINNNPYIRVDADNVVYLRLQQFNDPNFPEPMKLELSTGEIIAMAADYFTQANWTMDLTLPHCEKFESPVTLGKCLIAQPITQQEQSALLSAYNNLAAPDVTREQIQLIYDISTSKYVPFSSALNGYAQELMLYFRVKNYGEMITRNQTHFTPWSIKAYVLGHSIALRYAQLASEIKHYAADKHFHSENPDFKQAKANLRNINGIHCKADVIDLAHRYEALAYGMELFTFHYYSDHFATGHMSMIADLRVELQSRFGTLGSILANNLHDEVNRVGVFTTKPYDPTPNAETMPIRSRGDGTFDTCINKENRSACRQGMMASLKDIEKVIQGGKVPSAKEYGGLEHLPDVDFNVRQHQPLLIYSQGKIYRRQHPSKINMISPAEYDRIRANPVENGYVEVSNKWDVFVLVTKLRLFPYFYEGEVQPVPQEKKAEIEFEEQQRSPQRRPIPPPPCKPEPKPNALDWRTRREEFKDKQEFMDTMDGLKKHSVLRIKHKKSKQHEEESRREHSHSPS